MVRYNMTRTKFQIDNLGQKIIVVAAIQFASTILNSVATYEQYKDPIDAGSTIVSFAALTIPGAIGSFGSTMYLKSNEPYNYLYLGLHAIPLTTRAITYFFVPGYS